MLVDSISRLVLQRRNTVFRKIKLFPLSDEKLGKLVLFFFLGWGPMLKAVLALWTKYVQVALCFGLGLRFVRWLRTAFSMEEKTLDVSETCV
jgi:hypothetical protein